MGDPKKPKKKWRGPRHPWRKEVLLSELELVGKYGLRNKRELWKAKTMLRNIRNQARSLLALPEPLRSERLKVLVSKLVRLGIVSGDVTIDEILGLTVEDILRRRLQTVVHDKGLAKSIYHARQLITHRHIVIDGQIVSRPGYIVKRGEEDKIVVRGVNNE